MRQQSSRSILILRGEWTVEHKTMPISGYTYGTAEVATSPISLEELDLLKQSVGFNGDDERYLRLAGEVLADQAAEVIARWRGVVAAHPHLARYSEGPGGHPDAHYSAASE